MAKTTMSPKRFQEILDAYGADPQRWPEPDRAAATALLSNSLPARRVHRDALRLDQMLHTPALPAIGTTDIDLIVARSVGLTQLPPRHGWLDHLAARIGELFDLDLRPSALWPHAAGLAAVIVLGFALGISEPLGSDQATYDLDVPVSETVL